MERTVNELLVIQKSLKVRLAQLQTMESESTKRSRWMISDQKEKIEEPTYDIKKVDQKIVKINNALLGIDAKIKESNSRTRIDCDINVDELMSAIE